MELNTILTGIDRISEFQDELKYKNVALLSTGTALNRWMVPTLQSVNDRLSLTALFGMEYGIQGERQPGELYDSYMDIWTGLPVFSLYRYGATHFSQEMLAAFDVLLIDLPLSGTRFDSYIPAIHRLLRQLGGKNKKVIILDRPNRLGGVKIEGAPLQIGAREDEDDFIIPIRYGLTLGELALMMNGEDELGMDLEVVRAKGWKREMEFPEMNRPWIVPQQHLPSYEACLLSVGMELLSGTNVSIGHGTSMPYQNIGAPWLDAIQLCASLNKRNISGLLFHPIYFVPTIGKYQGELCQGVQIHVMDRKKVKPLKFGMELVNEIRARAKNDFRFEEDQKGKYTIDYLFGSNRFRRQPEDYPVILSDSEKQAVQFAKMREPYLLYE